MCLNDSGRNSHTNLNSWEDVDGNIEYEVWQCLKEYRDDDAWIIMACCRC